MLYSGLPAQSPNGVVGDRQKKSGMLTYNGPFVASENRKADDYSVPTDVTSVPILF